MWLIEGSDNLALVHPEGHADEAPGAIDMSYRGRNSASTGLSMAEVIAAP